MNLSFKLGKVNIPVSELVAVQLEGIEVTVTDYDLKEGLAVAKAVPGILKELKEVFEEGSPSAGKVEEVEDGSIGFGEINHPLFGKGMAVKMPKNHPLASIFEAAMKAKEEQEKNEGFGFKL